MTFWLVLPHETICLSLDTINTGITVGFALLIIVYGGQISTRVFKVLEHSNVGLHIIGFFDKFR